MAKYTVSYACGHGSTEEQLYGPGKDRERRIAWLQANRVCRDCYIAAEKQRDADAERLVHVTLRGMSGEVVARISGGVEANKDALKALGYGWSRDYGGTMDLLATRESPLALCKTHPYRSAEAAEAWADGVAGELAHLGYKLRVGISPLDISAMRLTLAERAETKAAQEAAVAASPRPARPDWLQAFFAATPGAKWNGTVYGGLGRRSIYIAGNKHSITDEQAREALGYWNALVAYRAAAKA